VLSHLSKSYGNATILENINLSVEPGEFVSLIGPSGCGKSTILKLAAGLTAPSAGTVTVNGTRPEQSRKSTSFIFQDATLLPWRTVEENVGLQLELEGAPKAQRREKTAALLELVGLGRAARLYPRQLSGGMKMRVSIARALSTEPRLLLMDEPFAALDEMSRDRLNEEILRLKAEQQWTGVFVTHSVAEAVFLSTRVLILSAHPGRIAHQVAIDLPHPRTAETRMQPAYEALVAHVSRTLRGVAAAEPEPARVVVAPESYSVNAVGQEAQVS
jgi:NitT/TauT family transport system ATP-binding protein